ncbi:50S ribosomal protein L29 [Limibacterium fermenti]|jgi:large subunit ribosomal protein L29|uniref:50S ribosomal protein L29 n=1 Tax=Limibacterium fermenti TaxID=3229863 RepID=UPI003A60652F
MKTKNEEYKELSDKDLSDKLEAEVTELTQMRINHTITPLDNSGLLKQKRRSIARIHTELHVRKTKKA